MNPSEAFQHAASASSLGDITSPALEAYILDNNSLTSDSLVGRDRLGTISQLIIKLDPTYAYHANGSHEKQKKFISFIFG